MFATLLNNAATGYQVPVKIGLLKGAVLIRARSKLHVINLVPRSQSVQGCRNVFRGKLCLYFGILRENYKVWYVNTSIWTVRHMQVFIITYKFFTFFKLTL